MSSESRSRPPVPDLLRVFDWAERFELLDCIGSGAMGQVWRARERDSEKIVALKMLDPARVGDEQTLARLDIEAATLMKLREAGAHANVVPILDFKLTESHACLVMEFIPGLNLKKWCEAHRLGLKERVHLIAQVARASGWFHALGIVHRDLKPANILVNAVTHQPVIVDFSIAKLDDSLPLTLTNEALGTAPYMAPEQIDRSRGGIIPATDVYALGATLYELLTQVHPHPGDLTQVVRRHAEEVRPAPPSALNPEVPRDLESIVLKALSHRPGDRYMDGAALAEDLERFLAGEPVQARPLSLLTRLVRQARRKPALTTALAACVALGAFALWNVRHLAAQRERFALESQLTSAMQQEAWSQSSLSAAETTLMTLAQHDPALAGSLRERLQQDVLGDMEARLQQPHLLDADFTWLRSTAEWLKPRLPEEAAHLQTLITDRLGRWETLAELHSPFTDLLGLFPRSNVRVTDGLLYALHDQPNSNPAPIVITDAASVPMEVDCTFVAEGGTFHHLALDFSHQSAYLVLLLYKVQHTPKGVLTQMGLESAAPESYVLYFNLNSKYYDGAQNHGIHIPDSRLLEKPFRLTLRVERGLAEASLNGRWSLRLDSPFALGSMKPANYCRISWPTDIGLQHLALRTRRADTASPLEGADLLAVQGRWAEARRLFENLRGDPHFGIEAECKIAQCRLSEGDDGAAVAIWERVAQGKPSVWRDRCLIQLWLHSHQRHDLAAASRYAALLPAHLSSDTLRQIDPQARKELSETFVSLCMGLAQPRVDPLALTQATQIYRLLQTPPLELANRVGMTHHFARLGHEAQELYRAGLDDPAGRAQGSLTFATNCLDQWCRLVPSEKQPLLASRLDFWKGTMKSAVTVQAIWHMEQARRAAREPNLRAAITSIRQAREVTPDKLDNRLHTSLWLLEGMLYRMQGTEDRAQSAWRKAQTIAAKVTQRHPLHLFDCVQLHSLTQSWDLRTAGEVLTTLAGRHLQGAESAAAQAAFNQTFLTDPAWLTTFNAVLQDERGRRFAEDYALCREPPRELVRRFYRLLFEHYFLSTAFPQASAEQSTRVRQIADQLVTEMAMNPHGEMAHLHAYLRAWNDRAAAWTLFDQTYPYSPALVENMKWLLSMRQRQWIVKAEE
jgi:predicted Ser/Thr protein kinase/tetratricopeptide (TPR) repeat protein